MTPSFDFSAIERIARDADRVKAEGDPRPYYAVFRELLAEHNRRSAEADRLRARRPRLVKIRIAFTVTVDRDGWEANFPDTPDLRQIRDGLEDVAHSAVATYIDKIGA